MRALRFHEYGGPEVLTVDDIPIPAPGSGEVLVKVAATSFNPADIAIRSGALADRFPLNLPHTLGMDLAGTVTAASDGEEEHIGENVVAFLPPVIPGAAAEFVVVPTSLIVAAPRSIPLVDAAALPSTGMTAWQALHEHGLLTAGQRLLIVGAGSVVGSYATQLAITAGADVTAIAGPGSVDRVRSYGAQRVIDYSTRPLRALESEPFDLVFNVAPDEYTDLEKHVRDGGRLVSASSPVDAQASRITAIRMGAHPDQDALRLLVQEIDAGRLAVNVTARHALEEAGQIHATRIPGKTLLLPTPTT